MLIPFEFRPISVSAPKITSFSVQLTQIWTLSALPFQLHFEPTFHYSEVHHGGRESEGNEQEGGEQVLEFPDQGMVEGGERSAVNGCVVTA